MPQRSYEINFTCFVLLFTLEDGYFDAQNKGKFEQPVEHKPLLVTQGNRIITCLTYPQCCRPRQHELYFRHILNNKSPFVRFSKSKCHQFNVMLSVCDSHQPVSLCCASLVWVYRLAGASCEYYWQRTFCHRIYTGDSFPSGELFACAFEQQIF